MTTKETAEMLIRAALNGAIIHSRNTGGTGYLSLCSVEMCAEKALENTGWKLEPASRIHGTDQFCLTLAPEKPDGAKPHSFNF